MRAKDDKCDKNLIVNRPFTLSVKLFVTEMLLDPFEE
jgi:hypothetical protein